jgi:hypothetical protein
LDNSHRDAGAGHSSQSSNSPLGLEIIAVALPKHDSDDHQLQSINNTSISRSMLNNIEDTKKTTVAIVAADMMTTHANGDDALKINAIDSTMKSNMQNGQLIATTNGI